MKPVPAPATSLAVVAAAFTLVLSLPVPAKAELHLFTSAEDVTSSFMAHLVKYDEKSDKVKVRFDGGRISIFPAAKLCDEDRAWVKQQYEVIKVGRNVRIDASVKHGDRKIKKSSGKKSIDTSKYFEVEISNSSGREEVSDLKIEYEIHVTKGGKRGVVKGESEHISTLFSGVPHRFKTIEVDLSQSIPLSTSSGGAGCST